MIRIAAPDYGSRLPRLAADNPFLEFVNSNWQFRKVTAVRIQLSSQAGQVDSSASISPNKRYTEQLSLNRNLTFKLGNENSSCDPGLSVIEEAQLES